MDGAFSMPILPGYWWQAHGEHTPIKKAGLSVPAKNG